MTRTAETREFIDSVNGTLGAVTMTHDEPETELAATIDNGLPYMPGIDVTLGRAEPIVSALAWCAEDGGDDATELYPDGGTDDGDPNTTLWLWVFVAILAGAVIVAGVVLFAVMREHSEPAASKPPEWTQPTTITVPPAPSPDDAVVPSTPAAPPPPPPPLSIDEQYLGALRADGITSGGGDSGSVGVAHAICRALDRGESREQLVTELLQQNPALNGHPALARDIMDAAITYYCPPPQP